MPQKKKPKTPGRWEARQPRRIVDAVIQAAVKRKDEVIAYDASTPVTSWYASLGSVEDFVPADAHELELWRRFVSPSGFVNGSAAAAATAARLVLVDRVLRSRMSEQHDRLLAAQAAKRRRPKSR